MTRALGLPEDIVNVEGGAIAHGHPIGATGAVLTTRLIHSMHRDVSNAASSPCASAAAKASRSHSRSSPSSDAAVRLGASLEGRRHAPDRPKIAAFGAPSCLSYAPLRRHAWVATGYQGRRTEERHQPVIVSLVGSPAQSIDQDIDAVSANLARCHGALQQFRQGPGQPVERIDHKLRGTVRGHGERCRMPFFVAMNSTPACSQRRSASTGGFLSRDAWPVRQAVPLRAGRPPRIGPLWWKVPIQYPDPDTSTPRCDLQAAFAQPPQAIRRNARMEAVA